MLNKLALRNARRSIRDYLIYLVTLAVTAALMFAFNSLMFSEDILKFYREGGMILGVMMGLASLFIVFIMAWLIHYMIRFMLEKRSREFGTYMLLGIKKKDIGRLFIRENLILGAAAFLVGLAPGIFLQQVLTVVFYSIFGTQYQLSVTVSGWGLFTTVCLYSVVYFFALLKNKSRFKKMNIHNLIYLDRQNEQLRKKQGRLSGLLSVGAVAYFVVFAVFLFTGKFTMANVWPMTAGLVVTAYLFYVGLSGGAAVYIERKGKLVYRGAGLFILRQMASKVKTMQFTMGTLTVLFAVALCGSSVAMMFSDYQSKQLDSDLPFDVLVFSDQPKDDFHRQRTILAQNAKVNSGFIYSIYKDGTDRVNSYLYNHLPYFKENKPMKHSDHKSTMAEYFQYDTYMKLSDYNRLRQMLGYKSVTLGKDQYYIQTKDRVKETLATFAESDRLTVDGSSLQCKGILTIPFAQSGGNGADYMIVLPDDNVNTMTPYFSLLAADIEGDAPETMEDQLNAAHHYYDRNQELDLDILWGVGTNSVISMAAPVLVKSTMSNEIRFILTSISYPFFYISIIFLCAAMTVLSVQQLSDGAKYKFRYDILRKLGMKGKEIRTVILKQLLVYYLCPVAVAVIISGMISIFASQRFIFYTGIQTPLLYYYGISFLLFMGIYLIYFVATYAGFKKNTGV